ncbi:MAG: ABC transporter permease [Bifidobacteriaceae bacterium]|jgi:peptide/nickel transport system permease protein|nr:ABC transporter permease [Bifidobacteriaceae bacterium]
MSVVSPGQTATGVVERPEVGSVPATAGGVDGAEIAAAGGTTTAQLDRPSDRSKVEAPAGLEESASSVPPAPRAPALVSAAQPARAARTLRALAFAGRHAVTILAAAMLLGVVVAAVAPALITRSSPFDTDPDAKLLPPSAEHWFGTDQLGRDLFARVVHGTSLSLEGAVIAVGLSVLVGLAIGVLAGFAAGLADTLLMRAVDVLLAIPGLLLAMSLVTAIGYGTRNVALAVGIGMVPSFARTTRAEVLRVKQLPYIEAAVAAGARWPRVILTHVVPNASGPVLVMGVLEFGAAILAVSTLSFLGYGAAPPAPEWGSLVSSGRDFMITSPWLALAPGLVVGLLVLSLNHVAKTIEEARA